MGNEAQKRWAQRRKELGLCFRCDKPVVSGNMCNFHKEQRRKSKKEHRQKLREEGRCVHCGSKSKKSYCSKCRCKNREYTKSPGYKFGQVKQNAKRRALLFSMTKEEFIAWYESTERCCHYCGVKEETLKATGRKKALITIDRKDNGIGYVLGNMCFACHRCNNLKSNFFTEQQWLEIAKKYIIPEIAKYHCLEKNGN